MFEEIFNSKKLRMERMISGSKSLYLRQHPNNEVVFNANIIHHSEGKIWFGDLDLTLDDEKLKGIADCIGEFCVLREMDARFGAEDDSYQNLKKKAVRIYV